jgi:AraC-like DNA-binding protein
MAVVRRVDYSVVESEFGAWETALGQPDPRLAPVIEVYHGYSESGTGLQRRLEVPFPRAALILGFGEVIAVSSSGYCEDLEPGYGGFLAGLTSVPALVESSGAQAGVQVDLTPLGAFHLFGVSMGDITNRVVRLRDLMGVAGDELIQRLRDAPNWETRFELLDRLFLRSLATNRPPSEAIAWAWNQIRLHGGEVAIGELADEIGWSHKHLIARFRAEVGVAPRMAGRIIRFDRAVKRVAAGPPREMSAIALECGYYDQAHMVREFRSFARCTPREFRARQMPEGGTRG